MRAKRNPPMSAPLAQVDPRYQPIFRQIGLDVETIFDHPRIRVWRSIPERENCTLDAAWDDGRPIRLHIKRYPRSRARMTPAQLEAAGHQLLLEHEIPTATLVAWGRDAAGRSFIVTEDLRGYVAADKRLQCGQIPFGRLIKPVADLAVSLHRAGLHHRDLYLCHFFTRDVDGEVDVRLIDAGRVKRLPSWPLRRRWIVKDLAQLWYSTIGLPVTDAQRHDLIAQYGRQSGYSPSSLAHLLRLVQRKSVRIARHDARLRQSQPGRNVSIAH